MRYKTEHKLTIQMFSEDVGWTDIQDMSFDPGQDREAWNKYEQMKADYPERGIRIGHYQFTEFARNLEVADAAS